MLSINAFSRVLIEFVNLKPLQAETAAEKTGDIIMIDHVGS